MKIKKYIALVVGLTASAIASANVIYKWETLSTSDTIHSATGLIEITDDAWNAGQGSYTAPPHCYLSDTCTSDGYGDPLSPIVRFYFAVNTTTPTWSDIDLNLVQGSGLEYPLDEWFNASFTITGSMMNLSVLANTNITSMRMVDNAITDFSSDSYDFGADCALAGVCSGATGQWVQVQVPASVPVQVPEPAIAGLFGIGLLGFATARRRKRKQ